MTESADREVSVRVFLPLVEYIRDHHGQDALVQIAAAAGVEADALASPSTWVSLGQLGLILEGARALLGSDDAFKKACGYRVRELQFAPRLLMGAVSPAAALLLAGRTSRLVSAVGSFAGRQVGPGHVMLTYRSSKPESSKLLCLSRQASLEHGVALWGVPTAHVIEHQCMMHGDDACEYEVRFYEPRRWLPGLVGLLGGGGSALALPWLLELGGFGFVVLALLGAALGHLYELVRTNRANLRTGEAINQAFVQLALDEAETRREIGALQQRERDWSRVLEEQLHERTAVLTRVVDRIHDLQEQRVTTLRGFSHDLRNPLTVMKAAASLLTHRQSNLPEEIRELLQDIELAAQQMDGLLAELMRSATSEAGMVELTHQSLDVPALAESLKRRLRALVFGRPISTMVFSTREAPAAIRLDPLLFDRVVDNLLTNAAKYTDRGNIVAELDGTPGYLTLKISDTGRGISEDQIRQIFEPGGSAAEARAAGSYGVGLSVVVRLLDQIGGRIEVMSRPQEGTTFWVHLPENASGRPSGRVVVDRSPPDEGSAFERVVKVRKAEGA